MNNRPYLFLGENIETSLGDELKLFDDYYLTRPTEGEKSLIRHFVEKNTESFTPNHPFSKLIKTTDDKMEWSDNYWIITHNRNKSSWHFKGIVSLASINLTLLMERFKDKDNNFYIAVDELVARVFYYDFYSLKAPAIQINEEVIYELDNLNSLFEVHFKMHGDSFDGRRIINDFIAIKNISKELPFRFLCYFTILEALLTNSNYKISNNSISYQLQYKLNLLNNRLEQPIDFKHYFKTPDSVSFQTIIEKLYQYRSDIAHGKASNFDKDLFLLKYSKVKAIDFVHELTRNILLLFLKEPLLIRDLKNC